MVSHAMNTLEQGSSDAQTGQSAVLSVMPTVASPAWWSENSDLSAAEDDLCKGLLHVILKDRR